MSELGGLVQELGNIQKSVDSQRAQRRRSITRSSPKRSPDQRNWKNALTLSEVTGGVDGRLPPIVEDKYFPRRTMEYTLLHIPYFNADYDAVLTNCLVSSRTPRILRIHRTLGHHQSHILRKEIRSSLILYRTKHPAMDQLKVRKKRNQSFWPILRLERRDERARTEEMWT